MQSNNAELFHADLLFFEKYPKTEQTVLCGPIHNFKNCMPSQSR